MSDLLEFVTEAHGGLELWSGVRSVSAEVEITGPQRRILRPDAQGRADHHMVPILLDFYAYRLNREA